MYFGVNNLAFVGSLSFNWMESVAAVMNNKRKWTSWHFRKMSKDQIKLMMLWLFRNTLSASKEVPHDLVDLMASFCSDVDVWDETTSHSYFEIDGNLIKTGDIGWTYRMAFGTQTISAPSVKSWCFEIPSGTGVYKAWSVIGIVKDHKASATMKGNFYNKENDGYGVKGWDGKLFHGGNKPVENKPFCFQFGQGDIIEMVLNLDSAHSGELSYRRNGCVALKRAFIVDKTKSYRLCVAMCQHCQMILHA